LIVLTIIEKRGISKIKDISYHSDVYPRQFGAAGLKCSIEFVGSDSGQKFGGIVILMLSTLLIVFM